MSAFNDSASALDSYFSVNNDSSLSQILFVNNNRADDINATFSERRKLYEEQNLLICDHVQSDDAPDLEDIEYLQELKKHVTDAKEKIRLEVIDYNTLLDKQKVYDKLLSDISSTQCTLEHFVKLCTQSNSEILDSSDISLVQEIADVAKTTFKTLHSRLSIKKEEEQNTIKTKVKRIKYMASMYTDMRTSAFGPVCPVCLSKQVQVYLDPCGHSFCCDCIRSTFCYICRNKFTKASKLYFS